NTSTAVCPGPAKPGFGKSVCILRAMRRNGVAVVSSPCGVSSNMAFMASFSRVSRSCSAQLRDLVERVADRPLGDLRRDAHALGADYLELRHPEETEERPQVGLMVFVAGGGRV